MTSQEMDDPPIERALDPANLPLAQPESLESVHKITDGAEEVLFWAPTPVTKWRVDTLLTKEPDTIKWIASFRSGEVLIDVGANVGMYTIWAAKTRGTQVYAFEPESQNYGALNKNIVLNKLSKQVLAYCTALSDECGYALLHLSEFKLGGACHSFGQNIDFNLRPRESETTQGCMSTTLDQIVASGAAPVPDHIKIDVDGLEHKVLAGAKTVLTNQRVQSVLVEINTNLDVHRKIIDDMHSLGFTFSAEQALKAQRKTGTFKGLGNYIFHR